MKPTLPSSSISATACVRGATIFLLAASIWQHLTAEPPYRAFWWDESWAKELVKIMIGLEWRTFLETPAAESFVLRFTWTMAGLLSLGLLSALVISPQRRWAAWGLYLATAALAFETLCAFLESSHQLPNLMEHMLRTFTPVFLALLILKGWQRPVVLAMLIATALTFSGHGWYAIGWGLPVPGHFMDMVMLSTGIPQPGAMMFLFIAGILDQIVAVGLFIPRLRLPALGYATAWGTLTSVARLTTYIRFDAVFITSLLTYLPEFFVRAPHFLVPIALWIWVRQQLRSAAAQP